MTISAVSPSVSLIVGTYGRDGTQLEPMLQALLHQSDRDFDVIIVDQNRDDRVVGALDAARTRGLNIRHVRSREPNLSLARNIGLEHARGAIVGYPDDDCWYEPSVIAEIRRLFASGTDVEGVVGRWFDNVAAPGRAPYRFDCEAWRRFRGGDAPSFTLFFKAVSVRAHGGFDVRLGTGRWFGASEETDLILRMLARGARIEHTPNAVIHHPFSAEPPLNIAQLKRARSYGRGIGALYAKHKLPLWVRLRGVAAPFALALKTRKPHEALVLAGATALGRLEGAVRWPLLYGRDGGTGAASTGQVSGT
jgi:glycosyltransferase involved in cell wall biosynthesis